MNKLLADACYAMATKGGYVLAFSARTAKQYPDLSWAQFRNVLLANGHGFCGYAEAAVRRAFDQGRG